MEMEMTLSGTSQRRNMTRKCPQTVSLDVNGYRKSFSRVRKMSDYYSRLGAKLMCEKCPRLGNHLTNEYDDELISKVCPHNYRCNNPGTLRQCKYQMAEAVSQTRASHTFSIKEEILNYLEPLDHPTLGITVPTRLPKSSRGLEHFATARFLIPRKHLDEFEGAPAE